GVVGPNGCGKSNLVEALRWVMGESSYKNMRASGMDDVIFSGSGTRPARNTAEVTLFLDNTGRTAPLAFNASDELQVSRRIERESGSVYRINGKEARAKDVQLLFADQSTGARSPSMVGQGRIGELIQAKPQARRALLEEAAGISGLHSRRHEAELRLKAAEANLERLEDVVAELTTQVESLKRQARQAQRFKALSADIRQNDALLLHLRWSHAKAQALEEQVALDEAMNRVAQRAAAQMESAKEQAVGAHHLPKLREAAAAAGAAVARMTVAKTQLEEEAARLRARQEELARRLEQLAADLQRENQIGDDNGAALNKLAEEEEALRGEDDAQGEREREAEAALAADLAALQHMEAALATAAAKQAEAAALHKQAERTLLEARDRASRLKRQAGEIEKDQQALAAKLVALPDLQACATSVEAAVAAAAAAESAHAEAEASVTQARQKESAASLALAETKASCGRLETEAQTLHAVVHAGSGGLWSSVLDDIMVEPGFEAALGAAFGEDLDLPLDVEAPAHWGEALPSHADPALPAGAEPLARYIQAPAQLHRRLAQIGLVSHGDGAALQPRLAVGQQLVTRDGALWRWDGFRAAADAPTPAAQRLAQKNRLAELEREIAMARSVVEGATRQAQAASETHRQAAERERQGRIAVKQAQAELGQAREALSRAERASGELSVRQASLSEAASRLAESLGEADRDVRHAETTLAAAPDLKRLADAFARISEQAAKARTLHGDRRAAFETLKRAAEMRRQRLAGIAAERGSWLKRGEDAQRHRAVLLARQEEARAESAQLAEAPDDLEQKRKALLSEIAVAEKARQQARSTLQAAEKRQSELDREATAALAALAEAREVRGRIEERLAAADDRRDEIERRITTILNVQPHRVLEHAGLANDANLPPEAEVQQRLERLKTERERLGAVNLRADKEQQEKAERLQSIVSERDDVVEAIRMLRGAISSLNREGRERLLAAFDLVNVEFQRLFSHLFGGGTAELQLIESDDPLEAGLEILARPPGKKPQTMTLLSGGEQALTAMALIFAVFLTNPAPICVLDEVDAPLDDHNVERFCNLMDQMVASTETRFIVITHNPITMARMNRLFGVTMVEQGVSQLVSVDLEAAEQLREAS
ncbi:MAG TPA: chromosome segregation SMC family protein, partial [Tianweitania sediminis]|nr:chromosome segregation SMC family protein [Tianweitania sediminis]